MNTRLATLNQNANEPRRANDRARPPRTHTREGRKAPLTTESKHLVYGRQINDNDRLSQTQEDTMNDPEFEKRRQQLLVEDMIMMMQETIASI